MKKNLFLLAGVLLATVVLLALIYTPEEFLQTLFIMKIFFTKTFEGVMLLILFAFVGIAWLCFEVKGFQDWLQNLVDSEENNY